jgi:hypothetical protein
LHLFVSHDGDDTWSGLRPTRAWFHRSEGPFRTLVRARDEIRRLKDAGGLPQGGVVVTVEEGRYELTDTFELTEADSGTPECPVTYRAAEGAEVRLAGGPLLTEQSPVTDASVLARLDPSVRDRVVQVDLGAHGVTDFGKQEWQSSKGLAGLELFCNDRPMTLARWPNEGFTPVVDVAGPIEKNRRGQDTCRVGKIVYEGDRPSRWADEPDGWVHGYWYHDWRDQRHPIESIDAEHRILSVKPPYHSSGYRKGRWFYGFNLLCELDTPGEYYVDRDAGILYFIPPNAKDGREYPPAVSVTGTLIALNGASHVTIRGFTLEACRDTAVTVTGGTDNRIAGCVIRNTGAWGAVLRGGERNSVIGCDITDTGLGGIQLDGGDRRSLTPAALCAENNHIYHYSRWCRMYQPGVRCAGVGNRVAHNLIHDAPHQAIGFAGNDHVFEFNEIHSVCHESNDAGAIYSGANWSYRGTVIRHNYLHDITGFRGKGCVGVYLDDIMSGHSIVGNVFYRVTRAAFIGGGRDNVVANNIFVDCKPALHIDARGMGAYNYGADTMQPRRLKEMPYRESPWKEHYPGLVNMLEEEPHIPRNNRVVRNICVGGRWEEVSAQARPGMIDEGNLVGVDPHFVDAAGLDFRLRPDSPAWAQGFERIPMAEIGLYEDPLRASWPVRHEVLPSQAPARTVRRGPAARHGALRVARGAITVDGSTSDWPCDPATAMRCTTAACGTPSKLVSTAWAATDGDALYLLVVTPVAAGADLRTEGNWGQIDAVEFAFRNPDESHSLCYADTIFNIRGFPDGRSASVSDAGASAEAANAAGGALDFAARVHADRWVGEWRIPLAVCGIDARKLRTLPFNVNVRRTADNSWMVWASTEGPIWDVDSAGIVDFQEAK